MKTICKTLTAITMMAVLAFGLTTCKKETIAPPTVRFFGDGQPSSVTTTTAGVAAEVTDQGGAEVKSRGFVYGKSGSAMDTIYCGSGLGVYSADLNNLQPNTTYVYEAFAKNVGGFGTSGKVTFTTKDNLKPTVKTGEQVSMTTTTAEISGNMVTNDGGDYVTERGICYGTDSNQLTVSGVRVPAGEDLGEFTCSLTGLTPNTTYYYCAYAKNSKGFGYGEPESFTTEPLQSYTIEVSANPSNGGTVNGNGIYQEGDTCTVTATANTGYDFLKWTQDTENGEVVSREREYPFEVTGNRKLVATFSSQAFEISATIEPEGSGRVEGLGRYNYGESCTLRAIPASGYTFVKWTENGNLVSENDEMEEFDVFSDRHFKAYFTLANYHITATATPSEGGSATVSGSGWFNHGDRCTLTATANPGYRFVKWQDGNTENPRQVMVLGDADYTAQFESIALNLTVSANPTVIAQGGTTQLRAEASGGTGSFTYSWSPSTGLGTQTNVANPTATPNTTTTYTCRVTSGSQHIDKSCEVKVVCPPTNLSKTVNGNSVILSWTAPNTVTSYKIYRNNTLIKSNHTSTTYTDSNQSAGTYNYYVTAMYNNVESPPSNTVTATIYASLSVTATASPNTIPNGSSSTLTATASGGNGSYTYSWTPTTGLSNSHAQSPTASPSTTTAYTVTVSSNGQSATANVTVNVVRAPTNLTAMVQNTNQVRLSWTAPNTVTSYKIYRNNTLIKSNHTSTTYTDPSLSAGTYNYQVTAVYNNVESPKSNTASATISSGGDQTFTVNGVSFTMKRVEGGTFQMGSTDSDANSDESPVHSVTLSTFYMGETEVTQALWQAVMGSNSSYFQGTNLPVEQVSWNTIVNQFIPALNALTGRNFRLPTEAEWEYAARGGNQSHGYKYAGSNTIGNVAWYYDNSNSQTHAVATKQPNELGLYDMSGNVWEWCSDWYGNYSSGSQTNPQGPSSGSSRVLRGGGWYGFARFCRVSHRGSNYPDFTFDNYGFRLCLPQ